MNKLLSLFFICFFSYYLFNKSYAQGEPVISNLSTTSGKIYEINNLAVGEYQYMDRDYQYNYIPVELDGCLHIKTCGNDKFISEDEFCLSFNSNCDVEVYIIFADKFPFTPNWLNKLKKTRLNVTRLDSSSENLKGYFSLYRRNY